MRIVIKNGEVGYEDKGVWTQHEVGQLIPTELMLNSGDLECLGTKSTDWTKIAKDWKRSQENSNWAKR